MGWTQLHGATSTPLSSDTRLRSWPPLSVLTGLLSWGFCQTLPNWPLLPLFWTATPLSSQPEGCFHHEHPGLYIPQCLFLTLARQLCDKPRLSRSECLEGVSTPLASMPALPLGPPLLLHTKAQVFFFSLSIHQNLEVSSVNPPILSTLIHLFVKLKSRLSLVVSTCNVSPCHPDGTSSSLSRSLHVHGALGLHCPNHYLLSH